MQLTAEQQAIIAATTETTDNMIVTAFAGAAKTTTLVALAEALPEVRGLTLAFNKAIRDTMEERMPPNFRAMTLNGCGFNAWRQFIGGKMTVNVKKNYTLLRALIDKLDKHEKDEAWDKFAETLKAIGLAKNAGYIPQPLNSAFRPLCTEEEFYGLHLPFEASELQQALIDRVCTESFEQARRGILDFDDMLLCPAVAGVSFDTYDVVLIDEAQDLSRINHVLLKKIAAYKTRVIAVGDSCQAIYGFRGADSSSMGTLQRMFDMKEYRLTISFRCSREITRNARWRAQDMAWPEWAEEGKVETLHEWGPESIPDGSAILCRNNAPLFGIAIQLIRAGRYPELRGRDVVKTLVTRMKKLGKASLTRDEALLGVQAWVDTEKLRQRDLPLLEDQAACMRIFIEETDTLGAAIAFAESLANQSGRIYLMTGHGAKGLEFENVFILDKFLCRIKHGQDNNILYVMETRAKTNLTYIETENYREIENETEEA